MTQVGGFPFVTTPDVSLSDQYLKRTGALYETCGRRFISQSSTPTTGTLYLTEIALPVGTVISNITFFNNGASNTPTHWWFGLFDNNRNALAFTADQTSAAWGATTEQTLPIATVATGVAASFATTYTGIHYLGIMQTATTPATIYGFGG